MGEMHGANGLFNPILLTNQPATDDTAKHEIDRFLLETVALCRWVGADRIGLRISPRTLQDII